MLRFVKNRWTFILALTAVLALGFSHPVGAVDQGSTGTDPQPIPGGGSGNTGDPDVPTGSGFAYAGKGGSLRSGKIGYGRAVGDSPAVHSATVWRILLILRGVKAWYFRY